MTRAGRYIHRFRLLFYAAGVGAAIAVLAGFGFFFTVLRDLPRVPHPLSRIIETPPTEFYAATGERLMLIGGRDFIPLSRVSHHFLDAVIATEDHRFWEHHGVDKLRTLKALWITLFEKGRIQGASTITQQLAKNLFFSFERSWMRKFQEMLVAVQIESQYSKEEILEAYVNQIAFGVSAYGIEQAARIFFGVAASDLTLPEAAMLAGLPKSPTRYNPFRYPERARNRQRIVLGRMTAVGYISQEQAELAGGETLDLRPGQAIARPGSYFLDMVIHSLEERYSVQVVYHGGLKVMTTLDPRFQRLAAAAVKTGLADLDAQLGLDKDTPDAMRPQGALVALETQSGAVRAIVGGSDYGKTEYNRAVQHHRLPGSGFKPFLYYAAFESLDMHPATLAVDRPVTIPVNGAPDWTPENFSRRHDGPMVLKRAFSRSVNSVAAQLIEATGPATVIEAAKRCGINSEMSPVYSLALGTSGTSPLDMASAFATITNGGVHHTPYTIERVEDAFGRILEEHIVSSERTLDPDVAFQVLDMMQGVIDTGTARRVRSLGFALPAAGKTGTTDSYNDAWFSGCTATLGASVWVGFDRDRGMRDRNGRGITGGRGAAPIWTDFMLKATEGEPTREFPVPPGIRFEYVDPVTGAPRDSTAPDAIRVALREGQTAGTSFLGEVPEMDTAGVGSTEIGPMETGPTEIEPEEMGPTETDLDD
ncbi:Multimodular transpeptidase-transglycosylase (EC (EC [Olavius algarvensis associated proteobacterium Delta 3]|nr:Multimodular transpeptidase-transglycosylase (EC (EC [Olavius algarvensis associated proteobacterium Delta 3]